MLKGLEIKDTNSDEENINDHNLKLTEDIINQSDYPIKVF